MIEGLELANDGRVFKLTGVDALIRKDIPDGKVALLMPTLDTEASHL